MQGVIDVEEHTAGRAAGAASAAGARRPKVERDVENFILILREKGAEDDGTV